MIRLTLDKINTDYITNYIKENPKSILKHLFLGYLGLKSIQLTNNFIQTKLKQKKYQQQVDKYLHERKQYIAQLKQKVESYELQLTEEQIQSILNSSVIELKSMLENGQITSVQLLYLYTKRTLDLGLKYNAITDTNFEEALKMAQNCDNLRKSNPEECKGELFGIVVSLKDNLQQKGTRSSLGAMSKINDIYDEDGNTAHIVKMAGGIPFVKTNLPQFTLTYETVNYIYGHTTNPWNVKRTPGGSSGGEGALIASRCSPLGIGTDIGGSVRTPSAFSGITGFKLGSQRLQLYPIGKHQAFYSPSSIRINIGPMGKFVDDNMLFVQAALNSKYQENLPVHQQVNQPIIPFNQEIYNSKKKLKIGYVKSYEPFTATMAQQRAVDIAKEALEELGHELVEVKPSPELIVELRNVYVKIAFSDGLQEFVEAAKGEKLLPFYTFFIFLFTKITPIAPLKWLLQALFKLKGDTDGAVFLGIIKKLSVLEYKVENGLVKQLEKKILKILFDDMKVDALIQPTLSVPALKLNCTNKDRITQPTLYTYLWNLIPLPVGCVPVGLVQKHEQHYDNATLKGLQTKKIKESMKDTAGLPLSVSVVTPHLQEELCLNIMKQIETKVNFYEKHFIRV